MRTRFPATVVLHGGSRPAAAAVFTLAARPGSRGRPGERALRLGSALPGLGIGGALAALLVVALALLLTGALPGDLGRTP
ncbi:hypothetical protein [Actinomadura vinacea]|uniref:hypothetical protein n=1 Tax=Actinomadura vinacea TaxID=115336 RepID=UPI0031DB6063